MSGLLSIEDDIIFSDEENDQDLQCANSLIHIAKPGFTKTTHCNEDVLYKPKSINTVDQPWISDKREFSFHRSSRLDDYEKPKQKYSCFKSADINESFSSKKRKFEFCKILNSPKKKSFCQTDRKLKDIKFLQKENSEAKSVFEDLILDDADDDFLSQIPDELPNPSCNNSNLSKNRDILLAVATDCQLFTPDCNQNFDLQKMNDPRTSTEANVDLNIGQNTKQTGRVSNVRMTKNRLRQRRKFPGPAGVLPDIKHIDELKCLKSPEIPKQKRCITPLTPKTPVCEIANLIQDDDLYASQVWHDLLNYQKQYFPRLRSMKITSILDKANSKELLKAKVELFCALIRSFSIIGSGGRVVLKDTSGEIVGTVTKNVLEEFEPYLRRGNGIILRDISVFSPSPKKHYLNITPLNVVQVFAPSGNEKLSQTLIADHSIFSSEDNHVKI